eukprot:8318-Heterococcus_DN1.PRE.1
MAAQLRRRAGATDASSSCTRFLVERPGAGGAIQLMDDPLLAAKLASLSVNMNMSTRATITPFTVDELEGWGSRMAADGSGALERAALAYSRGATVTFAYSFAADVPALVRAVDAVSYDQFLRCESSTAAASVWTTTQWLERMGAHSLGAFLANRIEVCMLQAYAARDSSSQAAAAVQNKASSEQAKAAAALPLRLTRLQEYLATLPAAEQRAVLVQEWGLATATVLRSSREPVENALFKSGLLGGWPVRSSHSKNRYWDLDWVRGRPPDPLLSLRALTELLDTSSATLQQCARPTQQQLRRAASAEHLATDSSISRNASADSSTAAASIVEQLLLSPLQKAGWLSELVGCAAADGLEQRAAEAAQAELLSGAAALNASAQSRSTKSHNAYRIKKKQQNQQLRRQQQQSTSNAATDISATAYGSSDADTLNTVAAAAVPNEHSAKVDSANSSSKSSTSSSQPTQLSAARVEQRTRAH